MLIFHVFHSFFTFYESWTTPIVCIHIFFTLGNIYIEAFKVLLALFVLAPFSPCTFLFPAPIYTHLNG